MRRIAVLSPKGGAGKTIISHLLSMGCVWKGVPAYMFHTDHREPMTINNRPYEYIDGRDEQVLTTVINSLGGSRGISVIDGGGNRPEFNEWISKFVDLVIIPVTPDEDAVKLAKILMQDIEEMGNAPARFVLNRTSSNKNEREYDFREFFSKLDSTKIAGEIKNVSAAKRLGLSDSSEFETPPTNVNNLSRSVYRVIDETLDSLASEESISLTA